MKQDDSANVGPLIGSIIIVLILILGGYYSLTSRPLKPEEVPATPVQQEEIAIPTPPEASTEVEDLSADAASLDIGASDAELGNLETELR